MIEDSIGRYLNILLIYNNTYSILLYIIRYFYFEASILMIQNIERVYIYMFHTLGCSIEEADKIFIDVITKRENQEKSK